MTAFGNKLQNALSRDLLVIRAYARSETFTPQPFLLRNWEMEFYSEMVVSVKTRKWRGDWEYTRWV